MISLRRRLAQTLGFGAGAIMIVAAVLLDRTIYTELVHRQDEVMQARAWGIANALQAEDGVIEIEAKHGLGPTHNTGPFAGGEDSQFYFQVWHEDGSTAGRSANLGDEQLPRLETQLGIPVQADVVLPGGLKGRAVGVHMLLMAEDPDTQDSATLDHPEAPPADRRPIEELTIVVGQDLRGVAVTLSRLRTGILVVGVVTLALGGLLLAWAVRRGLAPLVELGERAAALDASSLNVGLGSAALPDELEPIRKRFEELLARLHAAFVFERDALERERRFNSAVAHELRTPIAELRTTVEVELLDRASFAHHAPLRTVLEITLRMQALVEALMLLRRVETGPVELPRSDCDAGAVLDEVLSRHAARIRERGLTIERDGARQAHLETNAALFASVVENLVSNAVDHAPSGSTVHARVDVTSDQVILAITNQAPDLVLDDLQHIFEPFWRKDAARAGSGHVGLGLSITEAAARVLDMDSVAHLTPEGEFGMTIRVPVRS